jgi:hypothetical protein
MSNYRLVLLVCIFTKLALIKVYLEKLSLIDAIIHLNYRFKLYKVLIIKFIHTYNSHKRVKTKNNTFNVLFIALGSKYRS